MKRLRITVVPALALTCVLCGVCGCTFWTQANRHRPVDRHRPLDLAGAVAEASGSVDSPGLPAPAGQQTAPHRPSFAGQPRSRTPRFPADRTASRPDGPRIEYLGATVPTRRPASAHHSLAASPRPGALPRPDALPRPAACSSPRRLPPVAATSSATQGATVRRVAFHHPDLDPPITVTHPRSGGPLSNHGGWDEVPAHALPSPATGEIELAPGMPIPTSRADTSTPTARAASRPVSDVFMETDVREALQSLAEQAGVAVIVDDQVRGHVTAVVDQEPFGAALRKLLLPLGYLHRHEGDDCYVGLADPESALFPYLSERVIYHAQHRTPEALAEQLPARHLPFVRTVDQGGRLVIEAPRQLADQILRELQQLDHAIPQVILEVLVCVYSPEANFRFGFDVEHGVTLDGLDAATMSLDGLGIAGHYGPAGFNTQLNDFRFTSVLLRALEQKGYVKIRAAPRVMAEDGKKAEIHIGRETFFSVQPDVSGMVFRQDVQKVDSGIMLELTPAIRDPNVTVHIERAEVSEDIRSAETQGNAYDRYPVINRRRVATTVHVQDGQTIVIGGLTQRQKVDQINKLPVLGNLPYVGRIFQRIERRDQEAEVAIFITPHILHDGMTDGYEHGGFPGDLALLDSDDRADSPR
ncbi:type II secretion system protein GspD [Roseimaritima sediminicola]|uniref:type II secretion system protein GspD n=1 Tax=Roseimaritima sediminicola TaxID=2662066 RepID=UPI0012983F9D|nr:hypothetical protein [Roseimaritima sediminicola]